MASLQILVMLLSVLAAVDAWVPVVPPTATVGFRTTVSRTTTTTTTALFAGGFGGSGGEKKEVKLKPKQQWDRYTTALKKEKAVPVAVKIGDDEWLEVGAVKSQGGSMTEVAVARQRALIVEHAKRLYPMQVSPKSQVEWGYNKDGSWVSVDKAILDAAGEGVEKMIGFEGKPDPATGFYCLYNEGRLVKNTDTDLNLRPSSKKLG